MYNRYIELHNDDGMKENQKTLTKIVLCRSSLRKPRFIKGDDKALGDKVGGDRRSEVADRLNYGHQLGQDILYRAELEKLK